MIQRKQTVFLALAAFLAGLMYAFPVVTYDRADDVQFVMTLWGLFHTDGTPVPDVAFNLPLYALAGLLIVLLLACILFFRKRSRQLRLVRMSYLFVLTLFLGALFTHISVKAYLAQGSSVEYAFGPTFFLPFGVALLSFLAERGIRKDEELIKSMDRLR